MNWQKIKRDLYLATSSHFFYKVIGYLVIAMLARYLEKGQMGQFFFAATLATFFAMFAQLGTTRYLIREVASRPEKATDHFSAVISVQLPLLGCCLVVLNGFTYLLKPELTILMLLTSIYVLLDEFFYTFGALFLGLKQIGYRVLIEVSAKLLLVSLIFIAITFKGSLHTILTCYVVANLFLVGFAAHLVWKKIGKFKPVWNLKASRNILQVSLPFFALTILGLIHLKVDTIMLGFMHSYTAVATYEAGFKLLEVSRFIIRPIGMIFFPICAELAAGHKWLEIRSLLKKMLTITGTLGVGVTVFVIITAGFIIPIVFGSRYDDAIPIARVLFLSVPAIYLGMISGFLANALHLERQALKVMLIGVILNVALNSVMISLWGTVGAAWATVISEITVTVWLLMVIVQRLQVSSSSVLVKSRSISPRRLISLLQKRKIQSGVEL